MNEPRLFSPYVSWAIAVLLFVAVGLLAVHVAWWIVR